MKIIYSAHKHPHFEIVTDYIEKAFKENNCQTLFFDNRNFVVPGRIRDRVRALRKLDLQRLNKRLLSIARTYSPDLFLEAGGWNILPDTIDAIKRMGIKTVLWTIDAPRIFEPIIKSASHYDFVFTGGSEAVEVLKKYNVKNLHWLPFACDPDFHKPVELTFEEKAQYGDEICFVGSGNPLYVKRIAMLEGLTDFKLGIWGPGWETLPSKSPLSRFIKGGQTRPEEWVKIYSASKISLCIHYHDPEGEILCYQASPKVYEALACGAFLVVDNQKDVLSLFVSGKDLVVINNEKELREAITYYLHHPREAKTVAERGRRKVLENHTYRHRIKEILTMVMKG